MDHHFTLGSARCPHSIRQSQANASNNITTLFCDAALKEEQDPETMTDLQKICYNLRNGNYDGVQGVPANFSCSVPISHDALLDTSRCTVTTGFDENFGKPTLFDQLDENNDGVLSREEFNKGIETSAS